jgi:hypothetical protein
MAHHVHRATGLGAWVLINENWYNFVTVQVGPLPFRPVRQQNFLAGRICLRFEDGVILESPSEPSRKKLIALIAA